MTDLSALPAPNSNNRAVFASNPVAYQILYDREAAPDTVAPLRPTLVQSTSPPGRQARFGSVHTHAPPPTLGRASPAIDPREEQYGRHHSYSAAPVQHSRPDLQYRHAAHGYSERDDDAEEDSDGSDDAFTAVGTGVATDLNWDDDEPEPLTRRQMGYEEPARRPHYYPEYEDDDAEEEQPRYVHRRVEQPRRSPQPIPSAPYYDEYDHEPSAPPLRQSYRASPQPIAAAEPIYRPSSRQQYQQPQLRRAPSPEPLPNYGHDPVSSLNYAFSEPSDPARQHPSARASPSLRFAAPAPAPAPIPTPAPAPIRQSTSTGSLRGEARKVVQPVVNAFKDVVEDSVAEKELIKLLKVSLRDRSKGGNALHFPPQPLFLSQRFTDWGLIVPESDRK